MRHFIIFITIIFFGLFLAVLNKTEAPVNNQTKSVLKVFGYSSFTGRFGPGPYLRDLFEKNCNCKVEYIESSDSGILLQRLKVEGESHGADLIIGLDQFDLPKAQAQNKWRQVNWSDVPIYDIVKSYATSIGSLLNPNSGNGGANPSLVNMNFVPYDWGIISFVIRKSDFKVYPTSLDDLLKPEFTKNIAIENPGTSSPGLQFLVWVMKTKGVDEGSAFLEKFLLQVHSVTPGWTEAYGLFKKKVVNTALSYTSSPVYHQIEEKSENYMALEFREGHPLQVEYLGIPETCRNCELAERFINLILSPEGQKVIMEKNYMFPVRMDAMPEGSPFAKAMKYKILDPTATSSQSTDIETYLQKWSLLRRGEK